MHLSEILPIPEYKDAETVILDANHILLHQKIHLPHLSEQERKVVCGTPSHTDRHAQPLDMSNSTDE